MSQQCTPLILFLTIHPSNCQPKGTQKPHHKHGCLECILHSYKDSQGITEPIWAWIRIGDQVAYKRVSPLAFIIGDSQSQDKMYALYLAYANVPRICHAINVTAEESDNPDHEYIFISMYDINEMCVYAMQLYKPQGYGIGAEIEGLHEDDSAHAY